MNLLARVASELKLHIDALVYNVLYTEVVTHLGYSLNELSKIYSFMCKSQLLVIDVTYGIYITTLV